MNAERRAPANMSTDIFQVSEAMFEAERPARRGGRVKRTYRCRHCARIFKRSEHCARHERVHTQEKPFPCAYCDRRYARKDLVKRHERTLHAEEYKKAHPEEFGSHSTSGESDDARSSNTAQQPTSPLTPTDNVHMSEGALPDLNHITSMEPDLPHAVQTPFGFTPPSDCDRRFSISYPGEHFIEADGFPVDLAFHSPQMPNLQTAYAFDIGKEIGSQPPNKRRRTEVDPLLMKEPEVLHDTNHHASATRPTDYTPIELIDPSLDQISFTGPPNAGSLQESEGSFTGLDLSAEYGALFNLDSFLPLQPDGGTYANGRVPRVLKEKSPKLPDFHFDEELHMKICEDARSRMLANHLSEALLPTLNDLDRFFSGYLECFHRHFPIIHLPSLDLKETPSPLIFAICSIGAQYRLSRQKAKNLFALAGTMSSNALRGGLPINNGAPKPAALWIMQTRVLLSLCGMFSGKANVVLRTIENLGLFAIDFRLRKSLLMRPQVHLEWEEWISRESSKRLLCGMFVVSNLISSTFGVTPGFSHTDDLDFEVLDEERLWNASSAQEWRNLRGSKGNVHRSTIRDVMARMIFDEENPLENAPCEISGLTMLLIAHAVNIHMGTIQQVTEMSPKQLNGTLLESALSALSRCQDIVNSTRGREDKNTPWTEAEGPLMFNCQGVLLMAYVRLFLNMSALNRLSLLNENPEDMVSAAAAFAEAPMHRNPSLTKAVKKTYETLSATVRIGHLLLRKTAALSWSLEHAVAGWVATLLVTKWIHTLETDALVDPPDIEETEILDGFKQMLSEVESEYSGSSLAAAVTHFCSTTLNDVWVWGVTPKMAHVLQELAVAFEERHQALQLAPIGYSAV